MFSGALHCRPTHSTTSRNPIQLCLKQQFLAWRVFPVWPQLTMRQPLHIRTFSNNVLGQVGHLRCLRKRERHSISPLAPPHDVREGDPVPLPRCTVSTAISAATLPLARSARREPRPANGSSLAESARRMTPLCGSYSETHVIISFTPTCSCMVLIRSARSEENPTLAVLSLLRQSIIH